MLLMDTVGCCIAEELVLRWANWSRVQVFSVFKPVSEGFDYFIPTCMPLNLPTTCLKDKIKSS